MFMWFCFLFLMWNMSNCYVNVMKVSKTFEFNVYLSKLIGGGNPNV